DSYQSYLVDPLTYAAETAWHRGVVVVGATGNRGWKTGVLDPADDPYVIAVGSSDNSGTATTADDTVSTFSSGGDGYRNPDLVAALTAVPAPALQAFLPGTGTGSLDGARGSARLSWGGVALQGEVDIFGMPFNSALAASALNGNTSWIGGVFNGAVWTGTGW